MLQKAIKTRQYKMKLLFCECGMSRKSQARKGAAELSLSAWFTVRNQIPSGVMSGMSGLPVGSSGCSLASVPSSVFRRSGRRFVSMQ